MRPVISKIFCALALFSLPVLLWVSAPPAFAGDGVTWNVYHNPRYNYAIKYPASLLPQDESENGDGQVFTRADNNAELIVYASHNALDTPLKEEFQNTMNEPGREVTYKKLEWDWFVVSGYEGGRIFYRRTILRNKTFYTFMLRYEAGLKNEFDPLVKEIAKSFTLP